MSFSSCHTRRKPPWRLTVTLDYPEEVVLIGVLPLHTMLFGEKSLCKPRMGGMASYDLSHWGWNSSVNHLQLFCRFLCSPSLIYLYQHRYTSIYFKTWVTAHYYFIWLLKLFRLWLLGAFSVSSCAPLIQHLRHGGFLSAVPQFPARQEAPGLSFISLPQF